MLLLIDLLFGWLLVTSVISFAIRRVFRSERFDASEDEYRRVVALHVGAVAGALTLANYGVALSVLSRLT